MLKFGDRPFGGILLYQGIPFEAVNHRMVIKFRSQRSLRSRSRDCKAKCGPRYHLRLGGKYPRKATRYGSDFPIDLCNTTYAIYATFDCFDTDTLDSNAVPRRCDKERIVKIRIIVINTVQFSGCRAPIDKCRSSYNTRFCLKTLDRARCFMWRDEQGGRVKEYQRYFEPRTTLDIASQGVHGDGRGFETDPRVHR
jgi:hypothetical protein